MISWSSLIMVGMGSKCRSLGRILVKECKNSSSHSFDPIFLILAQNVCLYNIGVKWDHLCVGVKNLVNRSNLSKSLLAHLWPKFFTQSPVHVTSVYQVSDLGPSWPSCYIIIYSLDSKLRNPTFQNYRLLKKIAKSGVIALLILCEFYSIFLNSFLVRNNFAVRSALMLTR